MRIWTPQPGPQTWAYESAADELFYGGAAGGGKTDLLLGIASTQAHRSTLFRREYEQLKGIIERSRDLFAPVGGRYNTNSKIWQLPGGRILEFGAIQQEGDKRKWQGRPRDATLWDELSNFLESQYRFVNGWTRTTRRGQRQRSVAGGNPPTEESGQWVLRYWGAWLDGQHPHPAQPAELRWYAVVDGQDVARESGEPFAWKGETIQPKSRTFIPARLSDNPLLLATGYAATLQALPEPLRSQMLYGDFVAGLSVDPYQIIPRAWVVAAQARWHAMTEEIGPMHALGVDVARGGKDQTVLAARHGAYFAPLATYPGTATPDGPSVATLALALAQPETQINVDVIGVGGSVYDHLRGRANVRAVNVATKSTARDRSRKLGFVNLRAELWWKMREALDPLLGEALMLPPDPELLADLCAPRWSLQSNGIKVESKDDLRERLARSPDKADAVILAQMRPFTPHDYGQESLY